MGSPAESRVTDFIEVIAPSCKHKNTFIFLHDRDQTAAECMYEFARVFKCATNHTPRELFPHTRWVFPNSPLTPTAQDHPAMRLQWFDMADESAPHEWEEQQKGQLETSTSRIHGIIVQEGVKLAGKTDQIFVAGSGQGAALALHAFLTFLPERPLAGFVGVSGWLSGAVDLAGLPALRTTDAPILLLHSRDDEHLSHLYTDECARGLWELGYAPKVRKYERGGHGLGTKRQVDDMLDFARTNWKQPKCGVVKMQVARVKRRAPLEEDEEDEVYGEGSGDETLVEGDDG